MQYFNIKFFFYIAKFSLMWQSEKWSRFSWDSLNRLISNHGFLTLLKEMYYFVFFE